MTHFEASEPTENKQFQRSNISSISLTQVALVGDAVAVLKKVIQITFFCEVTFTQPNYKRRLSMNKDVHEHWRRNVRWYRYRSFLCEMDFYFIWHDRIFLGDWGHNFAFFDNSVLVQYIRYDLLVDINCLLCRSKYVVPPYWRVFRQKWCSPYSRV